jgi:hypothetical protein
MKEYEGLNGYGVFATWIGDMKQRRKQFIILFRTASTAMPNVQLHAKKICFTYVRGEW